MAKVDKKLWERWRERVAHIQSREFALKDDPETKAARIKKARKHYRYFVKTYFSHLATCECAWFHVLAANLILKFPFIRALFEWARGHAKSTHVCLLIPLWLKIQEPRQLNLMVLVSKSEDGAIRLLSDLQAELEYNADFIRDFGEQVKAGHWSTGEFITADGCMFIAVGRGQTPRGIKYKGQRPDYIGVDDIDDDEMVRNPKRVKDTEDWLLTALLGTMAAGRGRFVMVGNRIGKDSVLSRMAQRPGIKHIVVNALDKDGNPSWPENYTKEEFEELRRFIGERRFQREYMNNPITEGTVFTEQHIRFGKMDELKHYRTLICYTDPSFKNSSTNDFKATLLVGKTAIGSYHILKAYAKQTSVSEMVQWHYEINKWVDGRIPVMYYMESNFLQDLLLKEFREEGEARGFHIPVRGDNRKKPDKFARIEAMQPLFERGLVILNEKERESEGIKELINQLLMFEKGSRAHDDAPDALEGAIHLLTKRSATGGTSHRFGRRPNRHY